MSGCPFFFSLRVWQNLQKNSALHRFRSPCIFMQPLNSLFGCTMASLCFRALVIWPANGKIAFLCWLLKNNLQHDFYFYVRYTQKANFVSCNTKNIFFKSVILSEMNVMYLVTSVISFHILLRFSACQSSVKLKFQKSKIFQISWVCPELCSTSNWPDANDGSQVPLKATWSSTTVVPGNPSLLWALTDMGPNLSRSKIPTDQKDLPEVEIAGKINTLKEFHILLFIWMSISYISIRNILHHSILYLEYRMPAK